MIPNKKINNEKFMILFSPNTPQAQRQFCDLLGMRMVYKLDNYLALPLPIGKKKSIAFTNIIRKCSCRTNSWWKRLISFGGKEIFIKAILQSLPAYAFSVFLAPMSIIEDLQLMIYRTW